jgi:ABC-2 type transport system permease protein
VTDLRAALIIARRELLERVRSKWFAVITLLAPIGLVLMVLLPALLLNSGEGARIEIVDKTGVLAESVGIGLTALKWKPVTVAADTPDDVEMARIRDRQINGFVSIPKDGLDGGLIVYRGDNGSSQVVQTVLRQIMQQVVQAQRGLRAGIPDDQLVTLLRPVNFDPQQTNGTTAAASGTASFLVGYALAYILFIIITVYAVAVMRSVVQEKTSRVMELMVATIKPRALMAGKIIGVGTAGLLQITVWLSIAALTLAYREQLLGVFGVHGGGGGGLPSLSAIQVVVALVFFIAGYFFYASMYAAVGAMVSSEQDTQQVQLPITLLLIVGIVSVTSVSGDPRGTTATVMTMLPFWSALLMPMRFLLGGASLGEVAISLVILVVSTALVARAAAKIYRIGVLMYGKRPGLKELIRWLRY